MDSPVSGEEQTISTGLKAVSSVRDAARRSKRHQNFSDLCPLTENSVDTIAIIPQRPVCVVPGRGCFAGGNNLPMVQVVPKDDSRKVQQMIIP